MEVRGLSMEDREWKIENGVEQPAVEVRDTSSILHLQSSILQPQSSTFPRRVTIDRPCNYTRPR